MEKSQNIGTKSAFTPSQNSVQGKCLPKHIYFMAILIMRNVKEQQ